MRSFGVTCKINCLTVLACAMLLSPTAYSADVDSPFMYVSVTADKKVACYQLDGKTGELTFKKSLPITGTPGAMTLSPDQTKLYVSHNNGGAVTTFDINPKTGALTDLGTSTIEARPVYLNVSKNGKFLVAAHYGDHKISSYAINEKGVPESKALTVLNTDKMPHAILVDANDKFVYVPSKGGDRTLVFDFDNQTGKLTPSDPSFIAAKKGAGPRHFFFHPTKPFAYQANEIDDTVAAFKVDPKTGRLTELQVLPTLPEDFAGHARNTTADVEVTPNGKFVFVSNRGHNSLAAYKIDQNTGKLTSLGTTDTEAIPRSFNITPAGDFLVAAGQKSGKLAVYRLDRETGKLAQLKVLEVGKRPSWVQFVSFNKK